MARDSSQPGLRGDKSLGQKIQGLGEGFLETQTGTRGRPSVFPSFGTWVPLRAGARRVKWVPRRYSLCPCAYNLDKGPMTKLCWLLAAFAISVASVPAASQTLLPPLAHSNSPLCSKRPGVRAVRSDLVQMGSLTASLSEQATRDQGVCTQTAALWVNQNGVSQQFDLPDAATRSIAIQDIAPDASSILLSSATAIPTRGNDNSAELAIVSLKDGAVRWSPIATLLGLSKCDATFEPQGFLDATHINIIVMPPIGSHPHWSCGPEPISYSLDLTTRRARSSADVVVHRFARAVSGPVRSCQADPDVVAACYTTRARLELDPRGDGLLLWPVGARHNFSVEEGMLPSDLLSKISPSMRVYATMLICPLTMEYQSPRDHICIDSARDFRPDAIAPRSTR
jgi:hypothetical protein